VTSSEPVPLRALQMCFEGVVPVVIATASAGGVPNVTYLSRVRMVDDDHIAVSNQFFSKTSRNLAENPYACALMVDPVRYDEFRVDLEYVRTETRGAVFDQLRADVATVAALQGMEGVFHLRAADIYRVTAIEVHPARIRPTDPHFGEDGTRPEPRSPVRDAELLAELTRRVSRSPDLDTLVGTAVDGLADLFGYDHCILLLADEAGERLYTIASHGYDEQGVGSEVVIGEGVVGMAASRCRAIRVGNLHQMTKYGGTVRRSIGELEGEAPGRDIPLPGLPLAHSQLAVPAQALGELVGVLVVESDSSVAFDEADQHRLEIVATMLAGAIEIARARARADTTEAPDRGALGAGDATAAATSVRYFPVDGSVFLDGDYLIKGVAGRILWALLGAHAADGRTEFTNREVRLDPSLELPELRDNFESRLILLKRRLDERAAPVRVEKTGRGRFRLVVDSPLALESVGRT
jgi:predicted pyridoxine 5'-phosphate oxidase superfamily flavin-nucleotide-binding protein